jgi:hypothetical protein
MGVEIEEMTVDVENAPPERTSTSPAVPVQIEAVMRQVLAAIAEEKARLQRLVAD